jgi:hypothetical protein
MEVEGVVRDLKVLKVIKVLRVLRVLKVIKVLRVLKVIKVIKVIKDIMEQLVTQVNRELKAETVNQQILELLDKWVQLVTQV